MLDKSFEGSMFVICDSASGSASSITVEEISGSSFTARCPMFNGASYQLSSRMAGNSGKVTSNHLSSLRRPYI